MCFIGRSQLLKEIPTLRRGYKRSLKEILGIHISKQIAKGDELKNKYSAKWNYEVF